MWLFLLGIHLIGLVGFNLILRQSALKIDRFTLATIMQTGIALPAIILLFLYPTNFSEFAAADYIYMATVILLTIVLQVTNVKALQYLEASVYAVVYNLRIIITTILGIVFLHEPVFWVRIAGGLLVLVAIFIVRQRGNHVFRTIGLEWGIAAAIALSFLNLFEKLLATSIGFMNYFLPTAIVSAIIMWAYLLSSKRQFQWSIIKQPRMMQLMTLRAMSAYGFSGAIAAGALISVSNYISGMNVILMVLLGAVLLGETDYLKRKIIATLVAVAGLTLVLIASL
jgi:drug/metabolite transporter (DMT)-like permease